ncbi:MAG: hypothetical protein KME28_25845 [Pelatocladus maniniholoensis HA4357-MV3]|jgi:hypothetical protein|uniref:Uncharacterized protein n=1 Tax=Pelatocladus maniniholoensis HA4357-MV3 TaxID=1117104 RepID=A0A9E3LVD2_9NOST|nr:hypothetical protein [Pelatocladus maniniholoensis HA4357-MV3]BAZ67715.1 hypothetical protein NIES4106_24720 [Fischerella sp. NIES-4106]
MNDLLNQNRSIFQLAQILVWATNHPILSFIILLVILAIIGSIIQAIGHLIESVSKSILQVPLKLILAIIKFSFSSITQISNLAIKKLDNSHIHDNYLPILPSKNYPIIHLEKQQRLEEISQRLAEIQKEQNELFKEATELLATSEIESEQGIIEK